MPNETSKAPERGVVSDENFDVWFTARYGEGGRWPRCLERIDLKLAVREAWKASEILTLRQQAAAFEAMTLTKDDVRPFLPEGDDHFAIKVRGILMHNTESQCRELFRAVLEAALQQAEGGK